ncbi:MAG: tyrosine-type recombinase/integrase [Bacteroidia bacterium]|nr:tyrosine-type recombinase/integrase [Bacteroidia bacterium]
MIEVIFKIILWENLLLILLVKFTLKRVLVLSLNLVMTGKFLRYLRYEKRFSAYTIKAYQSDLEQFITFLEEQYEEQNINKATHFYIRSWIVSLIDAGIQARSITRKISSLRSFYKFQVREGLLPSNPMQKIIAPKIPGKLPHFVQKEKMQEVFDSHHFDDNYDGHLERTVLETLYATGMRRAELAALRDQDIDFSQGVIRVIGKRNKERIIPMLSSLATTLRIFLIEKNKRVSNQLVLIRKNGKPLGPVGIYSIVKKHLSMSGVPGKKSPHVLRHTFATHLLNSGADINAIKEILGHASLAATQVYTHNTIEQLKAIYKQAHPKA